MRRHGQQTSAPFHARAYDSCIYVAALFAFVVLVPTPTSAAVYKFTRKFHDSANLTEGEMFSVQDAPLGLYQEAVPTVECRGKLTIRSQGALADAATGSGTQPPEARILVWIFHQDNMPLWDDVCDPATAQLSTTTSQEPRQLVSSYTFEDGVATFTNSSYIVTKTGIVYVFLKICDAYDRSRDNRFLSLEFDWEVDLSFRNPYGYTPGRMYGLMPFYGLELGMLSLMLAIYLCLVYRHRDQIIPLHWGVFAVISVAVLEAVLNYNAWMQVNETGIALCYPSCRAPFLSAIVIGQLKSSLSRTLVLVVCMGLGVTRPTMPRRVWCAVWTLSALYFLFGVLVDVNQVQSSVAGGNSDSVWTLPAFCCELLFLLWISLAVQDTLKKLKAARQTLKASMYEQLIRIVMVIGTCWFIFVLLRLLKEMQMIAWPWRFAWIWQASGHTGYFFALAALAWTWGPSNVSSGLAHSSQIATSEEDADEIELVDELANNRRARARGSKKNDEIFTIEGDDDSDDDAPGSNVV